MSVNPDIHDKAYQFFIEEAAELLQIIEDGILELRRDRGANTVHAVMRAAHSIKGGAASVELESIKVISHRMETVFRALYDETVIIDDELEGLLLDGVDCLKDPLSEQIETGNHDSEAALAKAIPVLEALEANLGAEALKQADNYIPSSSDLGIDMVTSIFEIDVEEGIVHLEAVAANPENFPVLGEVQAQAEVFIGFGELLELPGFGAIAQAMLDACHNNPADPVALLNIALQDLHAAKELVMEGDRDQGGTPSEALLALAGGGSGPAQAESGSSAELSAGDFADFGLSEADLANFDFGSGDFGSGDFASGDFANADLAALGEDHADGEKEESAMVNQTTPANLSASLEDPAVAELEAQQADGEAFDSLDAMDQLAGLMAEPETHEVPPGESAATAAPDAELESMWAELGDDLGHDLDSDLDAGLDSGDDSDLDSSFELAMDQASEAGEIQNEAQNETSLSEAEPVDLFGGRAEETSASGGFADSAGQDVATALSVAEADAAFAAMVDASSADQSDAALDPLTSLDLSFDDEQPSEVFAAPEAAEAPSLPNLQEIFELDPPEGEVLDGESTSEQDAGTANLDGADLIDPWSSLVTEEIATADPVDQATDEAALFCESLEAFPDEDSAGANESPMEQPSQSPKESTSEANGEQAAAAAPEWMDEGTFVQGLDMGTFIQTDDMLPGEIISGEVSSADASDEAAQVLDQQADSESENAPEAIAPAEPAQQEESLPDGFSDSAAASLEAGTFIQNLDDGTFIQNLDDGTFIQNLDNGTFIQNLDDASPDAPLNLAMEPAQAGTLDSSSAEASPDGPAEESADGPADGSVPTAEVSPAESFDDGTFIQAFEEGTFIQGVTAEPSEADILDQPPVLEENFDEGTYVQSLEAGTFIQSIADAATTSAAGSGEPSSPAAGDDGWAAPASEESDGAEESLIPELQAFIAQAAAESSQSAAKSGNAQVAASEPVEPASAESELAESEPAEPGPAIAKVSEPQAPEPQASEPAPGESLSNDEAIAQPSIPPTQSDPDSASQAPSDEPLPSLETMFSVPPERLAAFAHDSLASEFMDAPEVEAIQAIRGAEPAQAESNPEERLEEAAGEEPGPEAGEDLVEAIAPPDEAHQLPPTQLTPTAVEVALAEHQALEPTANNTANPNDISQAKAEDINQAILAVEQMFGQLPTNNQLPATNPLPASPTGKESKTNDPDSTKAAKKKRQQGSKLSGISVRVDLSVLERMNNLVGELVLSRNSLSLQHEQLQSVVTQLDKRFTNFEGQLNGLRGISDKMLVEPAQRRAAAASQGIAPQAKPSASNSEGQDDGESGFLLDGFDVLEMDRYSALHGQLQEIFEQLMQLEEGVDDIGVLLEQSTQSLTQQRQRLGLLQNELMWARMLPLDNILGRFPRVLRDMARKHGKSVDLNMNGTSVLVDKGMLEKLHDPMLHLLRNAFDHGIENPEEREKQGKSERAEIQINAYYQGNQTVIEIKDDGQGVNLERIAKRAVELEWLSREEIKSIPQQTLLDLIFEPGFSTAAKLSELSGRGVGLDVVREQVKGLKGSVTVDFEKGKGTTFILRLPLTLTVAKLMVCQVGTTAIALPSDGIEDLLVPQPEQLKLVGNKRLLYWRDDLIPIQSMTELLDYSCPTADLASLKAITAKSIPVPKDWALPLLIFSRGSQRCAMEVSRLLMEQELVIKPFSSAMTPPSYSYGCTILGDGRMVPVLDGTALLQQLSDHSMALAAGVELSDETLDIDSDGTEATATMAQAMQADTILVVDDSTAMRRTMALSLEKAGYRVLQAGDGQEALTQLRQSSAIKLVICDVEMPNMNGFEFLSQRRREPVLMKTPVVMLTSRSSDKHRRLAMQLKAHDYFSKPYVEQDFLKSIRQILASQAAAKV